ncbi:MAG TPA: SH3 domain-containing protein [Candidatus Scubalenecus merdavium]|uniref:SH3 domain-containing protein n=1 Tax=Candidatus Scybalenecus merdavium TaxID=2840939 RepID=A0A9D1MV08_9FIRM|nr:SH3 domain-containing protein [Candidatus Scubalenecus merdavium]
MKKAISALLAVAMLLQVAIVDSVYALASTASAEAPALQAAQMADANYPDATTLVRALANGNGFDVTVSKVEDATGYQVRYATRADFGNAKINTYAGTDQTTLVVDGRAYDTTYHVQVRTYKIVDGVEFHSEWTASEQVKTVKNADYPGETAISTVQSNKNGFDVTVFKMTNATGYEVRYATRSDFGNAKTNTYADTDNTVLTVTGRAYDTNYHVQARTYKTVNGKTYYSDWTVSALVKTAKDPNIPAATSITAVKANENGFDVTVSKVADASGYEVRYATRSDFGNAKTNTYAGTDETVLTVTGRAYDAKYNVQARTYKTVGSTTYYSDWSASQEVTTVSMYPSTVSITGVKGNGNGFDVTVSKASNANGYEIRYATRSDFGNAKTDMFDGTDKTSFTIGYRAYDTKYYVQARAYKTVDGVKYYSAWSASAQVTTAKNPNAPAVTSITAVKANENGFDVTVSKVADATGYEVRYATRSDFGNAKTNTYAGTDETVLTVTGRAYDAKYYVQARTYKTVGTTTYYSDWSSSQEVTTASMYPGAVSITGVKANGNGFDVTVSKASNASGYEVRYATRSDFSNAKTDSFDGTDKTTFTIDGRAYDAKYYVQARAYKTIDGQKYYSAWSASKQVTTEADPYLPDTTSITSVAGVVNGFTVKWNGVEGASGYEIQFATKSDFSNAATQTAAGTDTSKTITGRAGDATYYVRVRAFNTVSGSDHYSDWSATKTVKTLSSFTDDLKKAGFPDSYIPALVELHEEHPNWKFEAFVTGLDWNTAVKGERTPHNQQLIQKYSGNDRRGFYCTCSDCYKNGNYVIQEGSTWVSASQSAVEYYMDPRNFLDEQYIFQFESTFYDSKQTAAGVEAILKGTWMYNSKITYKDAAGKTQTISKKYSEAIMEAAKDSGMSAYYLASKIRQEVGGATASAGGASGTNSTYPGIYNYYNIRANTGALDGLAWASWDGYSANTTCRVRKSPTTSSAELVMISSGTTVHVKSETGKQSDGYTWYQVSVTYKGKTYNGYIRSDLVDYSRTDTYNRPWTDPYKSIYYGAKWIYNNFKDQFTGYLQKFNVNPDSGQLYSHEYMANVQAAASEAASAYKAYKEAGILDDEIVFSIPVFKNMP